MSGISPEELAQIMRDAECKRGPNRYYNLWDALTKNVEGLTKALDKNRGRWESDK